MSQDTNPLGPDPTRLPSADDDDDNAEDALPPTYEEAISHLDNDSSSAAHHQHSQSSINTTSHPLSLNDEIQNSDSDNDDNNNNDESKPLQGAQVPNVHTQRTHIHSSAPSGVGRPHGVDPFHNSHHNPFGDRHQDLFARHLHHHHRDLHGHSHRHDHAHGPSTGTIAEPSAPPAGLAPSAATATLPTSQSATAPGSSSSTHFPFQPDIHGVPFSGLPNGPFPAVLPMTGMPRPPTMMPPGFGHPGGPPGFNEYGGFGGPNGFGPPGGFGSFPFLPGSSPGSTFPFFAPPPPALPSVTPPALATASGAEEEEPVSEKQFRFEPTRSVKGGILPAPPTPPTPPTPPSAPQPPSSSSAAAADTSIQNSIVSPSPLVSASEASGEGGSSSAVGPPMHIPPASFPVPSSGIPNAAGLISAPDVSTATFKQSQRGVETRDALLDDPYQLYRFFVAHNDRPSMHVLITGSHMEKRVSEKRDGDGTTRIVQHKVKVNDFKMDFDLSPYISLTGTLMALPNLKTGRQPTLREVMEEHVEEENPFKELHLEKKVEWDYEDLTRAITHAIRSLDYRYTIEISYPISNNSVIVRSSSPLATFLQSGWTKVFCFATLVGIAIYPLREMYKRVKDKSLQSEFKMTISTHEFYMSNYWNIVNQVQYKS
ncbi:hypothetical protein BGZ99_004191 [Dissophora globulifera]|uniref:Uncharacterized protein n=1 Tax=Dissophora globulifera TaxID=979702 RepID=A0A9P6RT19_9FUNG|nr:hypothetical protein BGZ99_004191 [Dissophora globulifera]